MNADSAYFSDDPVEVCLREMSQVLPLSPDRERECVNHIRAKDDLADSATKDLVEANLALVVTIAQRYSSDRVHMLDRIIVGNNALLTAAAAFADSSIEGFSAFATRFIENAIKHALTTPDC